jgi:hypothetical protein
MALRLLLSGMLLQVWCGGVLGEEPTQTTNADGQRLTHLISQLGSDNFADREAASQALERIGPPALAALKRARADTDLEVRHRASELIFRIENSLDQLLIDYRSFGLPLPPDKAPCVRFAQYADGRARVHVQTWSLGFLIEPAENDRLARIQHGMKICEPDRVDGVLDPRQLTADVLEANLHDPSVALMLALQMQARGWSASKVAFETFCKKHTTSPRTQLRRLAWAFWNERLLDSTADYWPTAYRQLHTLLTDESELDTPENRHVVTSLEAALAPRTARPGSIEALVDDLINARSAHISEPCVARILDLGFDAVPVLLNHLDDDRLTRYHWVPEFGVDVGFSGVEMDRDSGYQYRVRDMASTLLQYFGGESSFGWLSERTDPVEVKRRVQGWWPEVRQQGEEAWLVAHVLPPPRKVDPGRSEGPDVVYTRLLVKKYPQRIPEIYRELLDKHPFVYSEPLLAAIHDSSFPRTEKIALFVLGATCHTLEHRLSALQHLRDLDTERFVTLLVATLDNLPEAPATQIFFACPESRLAYFVYSSDDPRVWQALERAARRADPGLRMEMLANLGPEPVRCAVPRRRCLAFLGSFLEDATLRDTTMNPGMYPYRYAGYGFSRLEIRNFAALRIAAVMGKPVVEARSDWTAEQWAQLRASMREIVKRELDE